MFPCCVSSDWGSTKAVYLYRYDLFLGSAAWYSSMYVPLYCLPALAFEGGRRAWLKASRARVPSVGIAAQLRDIETLTLNHTLGMVTSAVLSHTCSHSLYFKNRSFQDVVAIVRGIAVNAATPSPKWFLPSRGDGTGHQCFRGMFLLMQSSNGRS